jgi:putative oxidoreductase
MDIGLLILRVVVGGLFIGHGTQKLFGWFGGYGLKGVGGFLEQIGYRPGPFMALVAGTTETLAGLSLASGFLVPLGAAVVVGVMLNAILTVKLKDGLINGYEMEVLHAVAASALAFTGAGAYSLDAIAGWNLAGTAWGLGALALGIVVGVLTLASRRPQPVAAEEVAEERRAA